MITRDTSKNSAIKASTSKPNPKSKPFATKPATKASTSNPNPNLKPNPKPKSKPLTTKPKKILTLKNDYISKLPDHLLHKILSFLSLKQAAKTSILSHRWRFVWASRKKPNFYMDQFAKFGTHKFVSIANSTIPYCPKEDFQIFKTFLLGDSSSNLAKTTRWIDLAIKNEVKNLHIIIKLENKGGNVILPRSVLSNKSLNELSLFCFPNVKIINPSFMSLKNLKTLSLQRMEINSIFLDKIISGCPKIQNLNLHYCDLYFSRVFSVSLRSLIMENCWIKFKVDNNNNNKFFICAPNLLILQFNQQLSCLSQREEIDKMFELKIPNLKHLTLGGTWVATYENDVSFFLNHTPNLEKLTLLCDQASFGYDKSKIKEFKSDLAFNCRDLQLVEIVCDDVSDKRIVQLMNILEQNGILEYVQLYADRPFDFDSLYGDCFKELFDVYDWINGHSLFQRRQAVMVRNFVV